MVTIGGEAPGGSFYTLNYTDEHGRQTTVAILGPRENFAILEPAAGNMVPIPQPSGASGQPVATPDPYQPRPAELADAPLTVRDGLSYLPASLPATLSTRRPSTYSVRFHATSCASQRPRCNDFYTDGYNADGSASGPTGTATLDDSSTIWGAGFETFAPGPGIIAASVRAYWEIPCIGFLSCSVEFQDTVSEPVTWVSRPRCRDAKADAHTRAQRSWRARAAPDALISWALASEVAHGDATYQAAGYQDASGTRSIPLGWLLCTDRRQEPIEGTPKSLTRWPGSRAFCDAGRGR